MSVIEVEGLSKRFRRLRKSSVALDGLSFEVPESGVFGFLGPNGSGKTTTIRCLLKLIKPSSGFCRLLGVDCAAFHRVQNRVGSIVETPTFFPRFSGLKNLLHLGKLVGAGRMEALRALETVGLSGREDDLVRTYSLGMKQRLGLAAALLKDPQLFILDEPAHGLDPEGIRDIRLVLRGLADQGRAVFLSSHLLTEVESMCDNVAIVNKGKCLWQGSVSQLLGELGPSEVVVQCPDPERAAEILRTGGWDARADAGSVVVRSPAERASEINKLLAEEGIFAEDIRPVARTLEDAYLKLTQSQVS